jgi:hypothetical protein
MRWYRLRSAHMLTWGRLRFPAEYRYILPSGILTAIVIPTTTLMYSLPISVMVAMVIMRGAIIVVSRGVDAIQIRQGLLRKRVVAAENWAVLFALLAVGTSVFWSPEVSERVRGWFGAASPEAAPRAAGAFQFLHSRAALIILCTYIVAYALRIYIMNYYKNTRPQNAPQDNKGFFAIEQMAAFTTLVVATLVLLAVPAHGDGPLAQFQAAFTAPHPAWGWAAVAGSTFGITAIFSVFLFMFQGRTATFAGLVNRLTSLVAGTTSTLAFHRFYGGKPPASEDWLSLVFILIAVGFLSLAERQRGQMAAPPRAAVAAQRSGTSPA